MDQWITHQRSDHGNRWRRKQTCDTSPTEFEIFFWRAKSVVEILGAPFMKNPELHNIDKFNYLKSLLKRSAAATIAGLLFTDCNYNSAIELLTNLFGNEQVIISSHMGALLKLPFLGSTIDVRKLRQTYDEIEAHVRGLLALEVPTESYGSFLVPVLMTNNPEDIRLLVGREMKDLSEILRILRSEIENRERCGAVQALTAKENFYNPENRRNVKPPKSDLPSTSAFFSGNEPASTSSCTVCKQRHPTASCHVVTNRAVRRECLKKQGRCFICLRKSHLAKNCPSKITSFKCSRRHHVSLCERDSQERNQTIRNAIDSTRGEIPQNTRSYQLSQTTTSGPSTLHVGSQDSILLQTAQAFIGNKETNGDGMRARVIFNSWSQKSYITQRARDQLNLPTISTDSHLIKTFGTGVAYYLCTDRKPRDWHC